MFGFSRNRRAVKKSSRSRSARRPKRTYESLEKREMFAVQPFDFAGAVAAEPIGPAVANVAAVSTNFNPTAAIRPGDPCAPLAAKLGPSLAPTDPSIPVDPCSPGGLQWVHPIYIGPPNRGIYVMPTDPCTPIQPSDPCTPFKPTDPCTPLIPVRPHSFEPIDPGFARPSYPWAPVKPGDPCTPVIPFGPHSFEPIDPGFARPIDPGFSIRPTDPCAPLHPGDPCTPISPQDPGKIVLLHSTPSLPAQAERVSYTAKEAAFAAHNFIPGDPCLPLVTKLTRPNIATSSPAATNVLPRMNALGGRNWLG
jgi:hypothetical protein